MYKLLIPVIMILAAWTAWRSDPAYSVKETLRRGAVLLLAVGALVLVVGVAVKLSIRRGPVIAGWTMAIVTVLSTAAFIWGIMEFTAPKQAPLRPGTPILWTYRKALRGQAKWFAIISGLVVGSTALCALLHWDLATLVVGMIGGMLAVIWGIALFAQFLKATQMDRARTAEQIVNQEG